VSLGEAEGSSLILNVGVEILALSVGLPKKALGLLEIVSTDVTAAPGVGELPRGPASGVGTESPPAGCPLPPLLTDEGGVTPAGGDESPPRPPPGVGVGKGVVTTCDCAFVAVVVRPPMIGDNMGPKTGGRS